MADFLRAAMLGSVEPWDGERLEILKRHAEMGQRGISLVHFLRDPSSE